MVLVKIYISESNACKHVLEASLSKIFGRFIQEHQWLVADIELDYIVPNTEEVYDIKINLSRLSYIASILRNIYSDKKIILS